MHNSEVVARLPGPSGRGILRAFAGLLALGLVGACGDDAAGGSDSATTTGESTSEATTTDESSAGTTEGTTTDPGGSMSMSEGTTTEDPGTTTPGTTTEDPGTTTVGETESTGPGTTTESESTTTGVVTTGDMTTGDELCASDTDCQDPDLPVCDSQSGECVACTPDNDPCELGSYCGDANTCVSGCLGPDNCPEDSLCDPENNACVATATSCLELLGWGYEEDGDYPIDPDGEGEIPAFSTYCDMTTLRNPKTHPTIRKSLSEPSQAPLRGLLFLRV